MALCSGINDSVSINLHTACSVEKIMIVIPAKRETGERPVRPRHCDGAECPGYH